MRTSLCAGLLGASLIIGLAEPTHAVCVFGMGTCVPAEDDAKQAFQAVLSSTLRPPFTLVSFQKNDGVSTRVFTGAEAYKMMFTAVVTAPNGDIRCREPMCLGLYGKYELRADKANNRLIINGEMWFAKTERGWRMEPNM